MKRNSRSIYTRLFVPIVLCVFFAIVSALYLQSILFQRDLEAKYYEAWDHRTHIIAETLGPILNEADIALTQWLGERYFEYPELHFIEIRNITDTPIYTQTSKSEAHGAFRRYELIIVSPLDDISPIGSVIVEIEKYHPSQFTFSSFISSNIWLLLCLIFFSTLIVWLLRDRFLKPLLLLHRRIIAAQSEGIEILRQDMPLGSRELHELHTSFTQTYDQLMEKEHHELELLEEKATLSSAADRSLANLRTGLIFLTTQNKRDSIQALGAKPHPKLKPFQTAFFKGAENYQSFIENHPQAKNTVFENAQSPSRFTNDWTSLSTEIKLDDKHYWQISFLRLDDGLNVLLYRDIGGEVKLRREMVLAKKNETVGKLTGGVAHDFNNLLGVVQANTEFFLMANPEFSHDPALLDVLSASRKGGDLTKSLLYFSKKASLHSEVLNLNDITKQVMRWVTRIVPENVKVETALQQGLWDIQADMAMTENAILNIIINARDAMEGGGELTIETGNVTVDENYIYSRDETIEAGRYVMVSVSDTGHGISKEDIDSIFDPFFTKKAPGKGSGVGLSMVHGFMKQSGGTVRVYSEVDVGTTFKLLFPIATSQSKKGVEKKRPTPKATKGARILLVEDNEPLSGAINRVLEAAGYIITSCKSGDEGYQKFMEAPETFDVILADVVMPGELNGPMMIRKIRESHPHVSTIFMSGYAHEATVHGNGIEPEDIRLVKPIDRLSLIDAIEKLISKTEKIT